MKKQSIYDIVREHQNVLSTRKRIEETFKMIAECHVTVGGSYMLKYHCAAFADREISDYDFILHALPENIEKIQKFLDLIARQTSWIEGSKYYDYRSIYFGECNKLKVNVILKPGKYCPCADFESLEDIMKIKRAWCERAIKAGKKPRYKDIEDIATYETWEAENDLPF